MSFSDATLTTLPAGIFDGLSSLTSLSLYSNALASLPDGIFAHLSNLTWLNLLDNSLGDTACDADPNPWFTDGTNTIGNLRFTYRCD